MIDFGAMVDGYRSDMTRTCLVGEPVTDGRAHARRGRREPSARAWPPWPASARQGVDAACRVVITAAGWGERSSTAPATASGLEIHEAPRVASHLHRHLVAGHVVTVEPGVYLPEHGGVRIEDTVRRHPDGCQRPHPPPRRDLVSLP